MYPGQNISTTTPISNAGEDSDMPSALTQCPGAQGTLRKTMEDSHLPSAWLLPETRKRKLPEIATSPVHKALAREDSDMPPVPVDIIPAFRRSTPRIFCGGRCSR